MSTTDEGALQQSLARLRQIFEHEGDVIALWEAIATISRHNERCAARERLPAYPLPDWICKYLAGSAEKVHRLWLGIEPADDRPVRDMDFNEVGKLRKVRQSDGEGADRFRDARASYVGQAFGFAGSGWSAFQRHDRITSESTLLEIYDDPALQDDPQLRKKVHSTIFNLMEKQEKVTPASVRNRLSKARKRQQPTQE